MNVTRSSNQPPSRSARMKFIISRTGLIKISTQSLTVLLCFTLSSNVSINCWLCLNGDQPLCLSTTLRLHKLQGSDILREFLPTNYLADSPKDWCHHLCRASCRHQCPYRANKTHQSMCPTKSQNHFWKSLRICPRDIQYHTIQLLVALQNMAFPQFSLHYTYSFMYLEIDLN